MTYLHTRLLFVGRILTAVLGISLLLLIAAHDLFPLISPAKLLLFAGVGALLLIAVVHVYAFAIAGGWRKLVQPRSPAQGK